jgi:hypothetical protein
MDKKFVNLPHNYKKFLDSFAKTISKSDIKKIADQTIDYGKICSIYNNINEALEESGCTNYDINKMIHSYNKNNKESNKINLLKKIASVRNKYIVARGTQTNLWNKNINNLKKRYKILNDKKISNSDVEKGFVDLLTKYKYDWNGLWGIFDMDKNGGINNINVFGMDDFDHIVLYINNKKK